MSGNPVGSPHPRPGTAFILVAALSLVLAAPALALRLPDQVEGPRVRVHALWNQQYLCLAARVPDTMLTGANTGPMSAPEQDDAVEFDFEVGAPGELSAHRLTVSAAGGMTVFSRDSRGNWRTDPSWITGPRTVKFSVSTDGTLNNPNDQDTGFVAECAIPWEFLGGQRPVGREIGFNVVLWMQGENEGIASWSPSVREPSQVGDAARWGRMLIGSGPGLVKATGAWMPCPMVPQMPFIDGKLAAVEWLTAGTLEFEKPEPIIQVAPAPAGETGAVGAVAAIYRYDWNGSESPTWGAPLWGPNHTPATADQPQSGAGLWFDALWVDWHAQQLAEVQRAGIDIIFARYSGAEQARRTWSRAGLLRLAEALKERRAQGQGYPLVGMMLDTAALEGLDLRTDEGKRQMYGMVREFFLRVPGEFWAELDTRPQEGINGGAPVLLGEPDGLAGWDAGFAQYCQDQFARDFGGARLVWIGSSAWRTEGLSFYSFIKLPTQSGFSASTPEGARVVAISPGYLPLPGKAGEIRPRMEGRAYRADWQRALATKPELVIISSWNDYQNGTEVAPSRQYGVIYVDITRLFQSRLASQQPHQLWLKQQRVPSVIAPGADCQAEFLVENSGSEDLRTGAHLSADYTITRRSDGAVVRRKQGVQALSISAGQTQRLPVIIPAKDDRGEPLPPGEYLFTLSVTRTQLAYVRSSWFARSLADLVVPFTVGTQPARKATVVSTSLPSSVESGATEDVMVRLRNDGQATLRPKDTRLSYHWVKRSDDLSAPSHLTREVAVQEGARAQLPKEVPPGAVASVMIPIVAADAEGRPLPPNRHEDEWHYAVQWDVVAGDNDWFSKDGGPAGEEAIEVVSYDPGVVFESVSAPMEVDAGGSAEAEVIAANGGAHPWTAGGSWVTYDWIGWDGSAAGVDGPAQTSTPFPATVQPGEKMRVTAPLVAPNTAGPYWVVWRVVENANEGLSRESGRRRDLYVTPVSVRSEAVHTVDLSPYGNVAGIAVDSYRARGDFDGRGGSIPAEHLPPDQSEARGKLYPAGYYAPGPASGSPPFGFPDRGTGVGLVVACTGQTIAMGEADAVRIHLIAASTEGDQAVAFRLGLQSGEVEDASVTVPGWDHRGTAAPVAVYAPYVRTLSGDDATRQAYLHHLTLTPREPAVSLELPKAPWVKIIAVTIETK